MSPPKPCFTQDPRIAKEERTCSEAARGSVVASPGPGRIHNMMNTNDNEAIKRRRLSSSGEAAEADDVSRRQNDAVSRLEQRMDLMEASFQREILEVKKAADLELLAKNSAIESQLLSMQDETDRLKAEVWLLEKENRRLEAAFKLHVENMD